MACTTDADCLGLVTGHWCTEAATCDTILGACVAWPRCRVTPWIGCSEAAATPQCVRALGPDGPRDTVPTSAIGLGTATGLAVAVMFGLALFTLVGILLARRR